MHKGALNILASLLVEINTFFVFGIYTSRGSPRLIITYNFLILQWCENDVNSIETVLQILNFDLFSG